DLNPVAVLINKAMIEIPPKFAGKPPVNPDVKRKADLAGRDWKGAQGLAEDVRYYGQWMRDEAEKRIGHLYPKVEVTAAMVQERPDLKQYAGKEAYVEPVILPLLPQGEGRGEGGVGYRFTVKVGKPKDAEAAKNGTKLSRGANFKCLMSGTPMAGDYIKAEGKAGRMGARLMAIVAEGDRGRVYLAPTPEMEAIALTAQPEWRPETPLPADMRSHWTPPYGLTTYADLFTPRQLVALTTFSDLVQEARERVKLNAIAAGLPDDGKALDKVGTGATAYADAVGVYLGFGVSKSADYWSSICTWRSDPKNLGVGDVFSRQAVPMAWDYAEGNPFSTSSGNYLVSLDWIVRVINYLPSVARGFVQQADAQNQSIGDSKVVSTDPPYYDNIGYADLSDFFYVWLRRSLKPVIPELFATLVVPKAEELVATPYRHGSKEKAERFFLDGMTQAMHRLAEQAHPAFPVTIYYAFKQAENDGKDGTTNTGWDTFLAAVIEVGFAISGTWPMRTELSNRMIGSGTNALASSIVLVCRQRSATAPTATRREFVTALKAELPAALAHLQRGNIAPVDLAQAAIGPGMAVYTRYAKVLDAEGKSIPVRAALALINQTLDEALAEQEGDFDADTRWALTWFEQTGFAEGDYGVAEQLSKSKNTAVGGLAEAGILLSNAGKVRLLKPDELPANWDPTTDSRLTVWEMVHQLIRVLEASGETAAAALVAKLGSQAETARELCYRLYTL
ncbi:MAG TPA: hypothetical protein PLL14_09320, partial [Accumulibacter sp.]|nr:hypothetical protein [Accumulibacter sp.]